MEILSTESTVDHVIVTTKVPNRQMIAVLERSDETDDEALVLSLRGTYPDGFLPGVNITLPAFKEVSAEYHIDPSDQGKRVEIRST